ncbi:uncharacterized protein LOC135691855 [Rhopilema esculentum]|uniref:uncharacterized protein LOC135691855 n=1 Tax=Rhopilema esculentum TaxID=499914 RepID=UPI0031CED3B5
MDIFMASGGVKNINDPDHAEFISSLEFLKGWPTEELPKNPKKCLFNFFRRGAVLVRDSNYSDWIYVVKSGSCQVLKKLKKVKSQIDQNTKFTDIGSSSELSLERLHDLAVDMARKKRHNILDRHATAIQAVASAQSNSFLLETENLTTNKPRNITNSASYSKKSNLKFADEDTDSNDVNRRFTSIDSFRLSGPLRRRPSDQKLVQLKNNKDDIEINDRFSNDIGRRKKTASVDIPDGEVSLPAANGALSISSKRHKGSNFYMQTPSPSKNKRNLESPQQKLAIIDEAAKKHEETAQLTEADMDPCFVQVAVLQKGDVFGLHSIFCDSQPSLSLVSNGAECIMVSKKFYLEHCTESLKGKLRKWVSPYPDDTELQSSLQEKVNWDQYRAATFNDALRNTRTLRRIRDATVL